MGHRAVMRERDSVERAGEIAEGRERGIYMRVRGGEDEGER